MISDIYGESLADLRPARFKPFALINSYHGQAAGLVIPTFLTGPITTDGATMSTWITNMTHFPKPYELSMRMPMSLIQTTLQFGSTVKLAVAGSSRKPVRHGCGGAIDAKVGSDHEEIVWSCSGCVDTGVISQWRGRGWDVVADEQMPEMVVVERRARPPKKNRTRILGNLVLSKSAFKALEILLTDRKFTKAFSEAQNLDSKTVVLELTIKMLDELYITVGNLLDFGPSQQRRMWDKTLNSIASAMDDIAFQEADRRRKPRQTFT